MTLRRRRSILIVVIVFTILIVTLHRDTQMSFDVKSTATASYHNSTPRNWPSAPTRNAETQIQISQAATDSALERGSARVPFHTWNGSGSVLGFDITSCRGIYFDFGTNLGRQIHKLFEPRRYPKARILPIFDNAFGRDTPETPRKEICAIGFEANVAHTAWLKELEARLRCRGFRVKIFTETAVATENKQLTFYRDQLSAPIRREWGASLVNYGQSNGRRLRGNSTSKVKGVDLAAFLRQEVVLPLQAAGRNKFPTVTKLDVEGTEYELLLHLHENEMFCELGMISIEWHPKVRSQEDLTRLQHDWNSIAGKCVKPTMLLEMDDETYGFDKSILPLPCK